MSDWYWLLIIDILFAVVAYLLIRKRVGNNPPQRNTHNDPVASGPDEQP